MDNRNTVWRHVDAQKERLIALSDRVWAMPEVCYTETRSCAEHVAELRHQGFRVDEHVAGIPTAVMGEAGAGGPVVAILGEYDALPGLSQEAGVAAHRPVEAGGHGHGCGHNLLGAAALLAATAVKDWLAETGTPGRVRYYGCPAEEGGAAKAFMVRAGAFADAEVAISWHPASFWEVAPPLALANTRADFVFTGRTAHAAAVPHLGRSALDAVELMSVGVNYMREHMPSDARVHYAYLDAGGIAPNVVQVMEELGPPHFDEADRDFAQAIRATLGDGDIDAAFRAIGMPRTEAPLADFLVPLDARRNPAIGSTDVGDVSWVVPTVQAHAPTVAVGTPFHTWQVVAQGCSPAAHKAMVQVAKAMAATAVRALTDEGLREAARADLARRVGAGGYVSPLPAEIGPPLRMSVA